MSRDIPLRAPLEFFFFFIILHIVLLKSECVLHLMGIFNAPPQLLGGRRARGEFVKEGELRPEETRTQGGEQDT